MSNREPDFGSPSNHRPDSGAPSADETEPAPSSRREAEPAFHMEEMEESDYLHPPMAMRSGLSLLCLGFIALGGAGWLMVIPAIGMMWSQNFPRWRAWAQVLALLGGVISFFRIITLGPFPGLGSLLGGLLLYAGGLIWALWEPKKLKLAAPVCLIGLALIVNTVFLPGLLG